MAKVAAVIQEANGEVSFMLDDGSQTPVIKAGFEFFTVDEMLKKIEQEAAAWHSGVDAVIAEAQERDARNAKTITALQAEIGMLKQQIAEMPERPRQLLQEEHQDIPTPRTLDKLAPLDALLPHPTIDESASEEARRLVDEHATEDGEGRLLDHI